MGDHLTQVGGGLGGQRRNVGMLERRGGLLPQVDRTRGSLRADVSFISYVVVDRRGRKLRLSLNFQERV